MIFIDSNVMIDMLEGDAEWGEWSRAAYASARSTTSLAVNHIVVAELASQMLRDQDVETILGELAIAVAPFTIAASLRSGRAFHEYRRRGGVRPAILADFLIAGHAATAGATLLTRDKRKIASYFPDLTLITPETDNG
jgi:predicted nucleic acid-binding protein